MPQVYSRGRISVFGMDNDKDKGSIGSINLSIRKIPIWKWFIGALLVCVVVYTNTYAAEDNTVAVQNIPVRADNVSIHDSNPAHPDNIEKGYTSGEVNVLDNMETHNAMLMRSNPLKKDTEPLKDIATSSFSMDIPALPRKRTVGGMITPAADPCNSAATQENLLTDKYTLIMLVHGWTKWEQFIRDITPRDAPRLEQVMLLWNNEEDVIPEGLSNQTLRADGPMVNVLKMPKNSMNNRFIPWRELRTAAVYIVDLDIRLPGVAYEFAFDNWLNKQDSLVGYAYRKFAPDGTYPAFARPRIFGPDPGYNMVLTGSAMMPTKLLRQYSCEVGTKGIRNMVDDLFNGDDIAMNLLAIHNGNLPVALTRYQPESEDPSLDAEKKGCLYNLGVNGRIALRKKYSSKNISTRPGHGDKRKTMYRRICAHLALDTELPLLQSFVAAPADVDLCTMPEYAS